MSLAQYIVLFLYLSSSFFSFAAFIVSYLKEIRDGKERFNIGLLCLIFIMSLTPVFNIPMSIDSLFNAFKISDRITKLIRGEK